MQTSIASTGLRHCRPITISLLMLLLVPVGISTGCGKQRDLAPLSGKVLYQGKPLQFGTVVFEHEYGQPATGVIQPDGTFELTTRGEGEGTVVSTSRVRVACYQGQDPARKTDSGQPTALGRSLIPEKYTSFETSGLTVEVRPDANEPIVLNLD